MPGRLVLRVEGQRAHEFGVSRVKPLEGGIEGFGHVVAAQVSDQERGVGRADDAGDPGLEVLRSDRREIEELDGDILPHHDAWFGTLVVNGYVATSGCA